MFYINSYLHTYIKPSNIDILDCLENGEFKKENDDNIKINKKRIKTYEKSNETFIQSFFPSMINFEYDNKEELNDFKKQKIKSKSNIIDNISDMLKYYTNLIKSSIIKKNDLIKLDTITTTNTTTNTETNDISPYHKDDENNLTSKVKIIGYRKSKIKFSNTDGKPATLLLYHPRYYARE